MNESTIKYRKNQFDKLSEVYNEYKTKVKFIKSNNETNWLDIENNEFDSIKNILLNDKTTPHCPFCFTPMRFTEPSINDGESIKQHCTCDNCNNTVYIYQFI